MPMTLADAKALAAFEADAETEHDARYKAEWERQQEDNRIERYYADTSKAQLIELFETGTNDQGKALTAFEWHAMCAAWYCAFHALPPSEGFGSKMPDTTKPAPSLECVATLDVPERMMSIGEVSTLTGIHASTIKRMVCDGRFPKPLRPSPRRIVWAPDDVRTLLASIALNGNPANHKIERKCRQGWEEEGAQSNSGTLALSAVEAGFGPFSQVSFRPLSLRTQHNDAPVRTRAAVVGKPKEKAERADNASRLHCSGVLDNRELHHFVQNFCVMRQFHPLPN